MANKLFIFLRKKILFLDKLSICTSILLKNSSESAKSTAEKYFYFKTNQRIRKDVCKNLRSNED